MWQNETLSRSSNDKSVDLEQRGTEIKPSGAGHGLPMEVMSSRKTERCDHSRKPMLGLL